jgi:hypothetical protein
MIGDFNEAIWDFEHLSSRRRLEKQMIDFREILSDGLSRDSFGLQLT